MPCPYKPLTGKIIPSAAVIHRISQLGVRCTADLHEHWTANHVKSDRAAGAVEK